MPAKGGYPHKGHRSPGVYEVAGSFSTAGASAPTSVNGAGFTVSAPSTGTYTITLTDGPFAGLIMVLTDLIDAAASGARALVTSIDVTGTGTFQITTQSPVGTAANLTGPIVSFLLQVRDTSATR